VALVTQVIVAGGDIPAKSALALRSKEFGNASVC
jgi:hypothetical protein